MYFLEVMAWAIGLVVLMLVIDRVMDRRDKS